jgi:hypothetical protein
MSIATRLAIICDVGLDEQHAPLDQAPEEDPRRLPDLRRASRASVAPEA